jgi:protocatechuate 3,4-dioxygenase beta subunit
VVHNDRESETRTPAQPLRLIPEAARDDYTARPPPPLLRLGGEADLTRIGPGRPQADGEVIVVTGRVLDEDARPVRRTLLEVWQCNTYGRYAHSDDRSNPDAKLDPNFYGFGRVVTDDEGRYALRTIKPSAYVARRDIGWWRPPHVHFSVVGGGARLVTQMYFPGEPLNDKDLLYLVIAEDARPRVVCKPIRREPEERAFAFDLVVRGRHQTPPDANP